MRAALAEWNKALLDVALPDGVNAGQPVVFACDDETIRLAGARLSLAEWEALPALLACCRETWQISQLSGINGIREGVHSFRAEQRPRPAPPWLCALALAVVAASRMDADGRMVTQDYYGRLIDLYGLRPRDEHPPLAGFAQLELLWGELAAWLADDLQGSRGILELPARHAHRYVGPPVSQTLFRRRDRILLGRFFARHERNIDAGWDVLRLLQGWGGRHGLTTPARRLLDEPPLRKLARSALRACYESWDGSLEDDDGRRSWPGRLRLAASPRRIGLYLASEHFAQGCTILGPDGELTLPPYPGEVELPLSSLEGLAVGTLRLPLASSEDAISLHGGQMLLFEPQEEGLIQVRAAREQPLWLLSRAPGLHAPEFDPERYPAGLLPAGWTLLAEIDPSRLPAELHERARPDRPDLALEGGLCLGPHTYLAGHPPLLAAGDLEESLELVVDGEPAGTLESFASMRLDHLAEGTHTLETPLVSFRIELAARGLRQGIGGLRVDLGDPPLYRNGATRPGRAGCPGVGPYVCGPALDGVVRPAKPQPVLLRTNALVLVLRADGTAEGYSRPQPQGWQRRAGLSEGSRWAVPAGADAEWVLVGGGLPRVLRVGSGSVEPSAELGQVLERYARAPVHAPTGDPEGARADFDALLAACREREARELV